MSPPFPGSQPVRGQHEDTDSEDISSGEEGDASDANQASPRSLPGYRYGDDDDDEALMMLNDPDFGLSSALLEEGRALAKERAVVDASTAYNAACICQRFLGQAHATLLRRRGALPKQQKQGGGALTFLQRRAMMAQALRRNRYIDKKLAFVRTPCQCTALPLLMGHFLCFPLHFCVFLFVHS